MITTPRGFGWRKDKPDIRDRLHARRHGLERIEGRRMDLLCHPILDQDYSSACCGHGVPAGLELLYAVVGRPIVQLSPWDAYRAGRAVDGFNHEDGGAYPRSTLHALQRRGVCPLTSYVITPEQLREDAGKPEPEKRINHRPPQAAENEAITFADFSYERVVGGAEGVLDALQVGHPVVIGAQVTSTFVASSSNETIPAPKRGDVIAGGHCWLLCGFDMGGARIRARNSWGVDWSDHGYCWLDPMWCEGEGANDLWALTALPAQEAA